MSRWLFVLAIAACGDDAAPAIDAPAGIDAAPDAMTGIPATCTGACMTTGVVADLLVTRTLDRGFYGVNQDGTLHVEAHLGGATTCPTMTSPQPTYSLILGRVPVPATTAALTSPGNLLDFDGDLLGGPLGAAATSVMITPVAYAPSTLIALDLQLAFDAGTVTGHLFAIHCASLDEA